jgi:signal transduction histidine kinase
MNDTRTAGQVDPERLRIARELHDTLGHHLSLISVQAATALHLVDKRPEQARLALAAIKDASRDALDGLRAVLAMLRGEQTPPQGRDPGLADIPRLIDRTGSTGLTVNLSVEGQPRPVPREVDVAAIRILQETLTNVVRHAQATRAHVRVVHGPSHLLLEVDDDGRRPHTPSPADAGSGLGGMRERVIALAGQFEAGPGPARGFRVRARLPLGPIASRHPGPSLSPRLSPNEHQLSKEQ